MEAEDRAFVVVAPVAAEVEVPASVGAVEAASQVGANVEGAGEEASGVVKSPEQRGCEVPSRSR